MYDKISKYFPTIQVLVYDQLLKNRTTDTVSFQTREFLEQRNMELQRLWQTCATTRRAKEVLRFHQRVLQRKSQLFFWFGECLCWNISLGDLFYRISVNKIYFAFSEKFPFLGLQYLSFSKLSLSATFYWHKRIE